ncbi:hypothetical protein JNL27_12780 [bacterium]|nr:hypothetical protein [bacterium]
MKLLYYILFISQIGCVSRSFLNSDTPLETIDSLNNACKNRQAKVLMTDGSEYFAEISFGKDTTLVRMGDNKVSADYANSSIRSVTIRNNKLPGMILGFFTGAISAGLFGIISVSVDKHEDPWEGFAPVALAIIGAPIGAVIGAARSKHEFIYDESADPYALRTLTLDPRAVLIETGTEIKIEHNGRKRWIKKSLIKFTKRGNVVEIRIEQRLYIKLFGHQED